MAERRELVVIGTSAGGVEALLELSRALPADFPASIAVAIHMSAEGPFLLPDILSRAGLLSAVAARDGGEIRPGRLYIAPPDHHLLVRSGHFHLARGPKENRFRPAIDPLFRTAAQHYGRKVIGCILTGNLDDGTVGLLEVKRRGGLAVVQDPNDALFPSMPESACRYVDVDHRVPLQELAPLLLRLSSEDLQPGPEQPVSHRMAMESKFASGAPLEEGDTMDRLGPLAPYSCAECHGPLWRIDGDGPLRFRCHVGHAYTSESLAAAQVDGTEALRWDLLRTLEERSTLVREVAERAREMDRLSEAASWTRRARLIEEEAAELRNQLAERKVARPQRAPLKRSRA